MCYAMKLGRLDQSLDKRLGFVLVLVSSFVLVQITKLLCRRLSSGSEGEEHELEVVLQCTSLNQYCLIS